MRVPRLPLNGSELRNPANAALLSERDEREREREGEKDSLPRASQSLVWGQPRLQTLCTTTPPRFSPLFSQRQATAEM